MRFSILKIVILLLLTNISLNLYSQKPPKKFGKISIEEMKTNICPIDSGANAFFIFDYGDSYFEYDHTKISSHDAQSSRNGFKLIYLRHFRIKVVNNQGFSWADIEIPLYHDDDKERLIKLRAYTYNLEGDKIVKTKLEKRDIIIEETNKYWTTKKFAMPSVREGSIIEVEYTIKSGFYYNLRQWYFQRTIPVLQSEYHVSIPEYFNYTNTQKGYFPIQKKSDSRHKELTITYTDELGGRRMVGSTNTSTYEYREDILHYYAKEIPAFPIEDYLRTEENYISKIEYELQYIKFPYSRIEYYTTDWRAINENLIQSYSFGKELNKTSHIKKDAETLKQLDIKGFALINNALDLIKNRLAWNGYNSKYVTSSLGKAYKEGGGNSADVNLNLVILLRELGFDSYPVILSTQKNGIIHPAHPSMSSFNYVIAMTTLVNDTLLMDATEMYSEINLLPIRCQNDKGRIVNNTGGKWINLMDYKPYSFVESYVLEMNQNFGFNGVKQLSLKDYAAYQYKKEIKKHNNIDEFKIALENENKGYKIQEIDVSGLDTAQEKIKISINFTQDNYIENSDDIAFFKPAYQPYISKNPFKLEKREYPVEFNYIQSVQQIYTINIPKEYTITEIPQPLNARTPDGKLSYVYNANNVGNRVTLLIKVKIGKSLFLPEEYQILKDFYNMIIDKQNQLIVLKKAE